MFLRTPAAVGVLGQDLRAVHATAHLSSSVGLVHERVLARAARTPHAVAMRTPARDVTFAALVSAAREIATALDDARVPRDGRVVIAANDHALVAAALVGVLGRGGVVVPLEPACGAHRLARMLAVTEPAAYVLDPRMHERFPVDETPRLVRSDLGAGTGPLDANDPDAPCSIYFTSGSTGAPRAILGRASGIDHHIAWEIDALALDEHTRGAIVHAIGYDAYLPDLLVPICAGGTAFSPPREALGDPARFVAWLARQEITLVHCTPSRWRELLAEEGARDLSSLRDVVLAGEVVRPADVVATQARCGERVRLWNLYGPTEATLVKLHHRIVPADAHRERIPIGRPMPRVTVQIVDDQGVPCAPGEIGEIAIESRYASHGYLGEPELTATRFSRVDATGEIRYLTGDLGRACPGGEIEFHGRRDRQLKLYGARIDLDEIEAILAGIHGVLEAAAVVDATQTAVFAFVVSGVDVAAIRQAAGERLSPAMRVARIEHRDVLPRTASGKIDRAALARSLEES